MKKLILIAMLFSNVSYAQTVHIFDQNNQWKTYPLIVNEHKKIFEMGEGSCLRGPLVINYHDGSPAFKLEAGVWYPTDCFMKLTGSEAGTLGGGDK